MRRIVVVMTLVLAALLVELTMARTIPDFSEEAAEGMETATPSTSDTLYIGAPEAAMICTTSLMVSNPEGTERWQVDILHPKGGPEMIEESFRLPQPGIPKDLPSIELLERYERAGTVCLSWYEMFRLVDLKTLGRASYLLETTGGVATPFDMRRALMKMFFKDQWQEAERIFPLGEE